MIYEQYLSIKRAQPDVVLLMQVGDFYQAFSTDARTLANAIGANCYRVSFGKRRVDTYGVPAAVLVETIQALLHKGHRVAIAEPASHREAVDQPMKRVVSDMHMVQTSKERE